ncbi:MAG: efflux RND transporter periplasmic adaptor subunit [Paracoccaceae bacterium]
MKITQIARKLAMVLAASPVILASAATSQSEAPPPKVSIAAAYSEEITDEAIFIGKGEAINTVAIVARVSGFVKETLVENGAAVEKDDILFRIEPDSYEATLSARKADVARAEAELELARIELDRKSKLVARDATPQSEEDIARANELVAEAALKSAKAAIRQAELDLSYTEIHAPFSGRIGRTTVSVGELVGPTTPALVTLVREAPIYVNFSLSEKQLIDILERIGTNAEGLTKNETTPDVYAILPNGSELEKPGKIVFIDNRIDPATGTISIRAEFENTRRLIVDGAFVNLRIQAVETTIKLLVPQAAVQRDQRGDFVLVVNQQQTVEQRYITTGDQVETAIIVNDGLQEGEGVIVEGLQRVRPGVEVDAILAGQGEGQ